MIGICPRCGRELVRSSTPTGKVCFRCASCGGVAVTLPVLRESLDANSIAALTWAARAAEHAGCVCPGCGGRMSLLKVGDGKDKLEIDVCGHCLSVWCDKGEYETLAPPQKNKTGEKSMRELIEQTSPEARERYVDAIMESLPDETSLEDFDIGDVLRDIVRLVIGAPTLWRDVRPVSPLFTILLTLALPLAQAAIYYRLHDLYDHGYVSFLGRYRDFWLISASMVEKCGFALSAPLHALSFPFVQASGRFALLCAILLFIPLAIIERRIGHAKFVGLFFAFVAASVVAQGLFEGMGLATGYLYGIAPVALGFLAYSSFAWPDLRVWGPIALLSVYSGVLGLFLLLVPLLDALVHDYLSCGVGPIAACLALGAILGRRSRKLRCTAL